MTYEVTRSRLCIEYLIAAHIHFVVTEKRRNRSALEMDAMRAQSEHTMSWRQALGCRGKCFVKTPKVFAVSCNQIVQMQGRVRLKYSLFCL